MRRLVPSLGMSAPGQVLVDKADLLRIQQDNEKLTKLVTQLQASNAQLQSELLNLNLQVSNINNPNKNKNPKSMEVDEKLGTNSGVSTSPNKIKKPELTENTYDKKTKVYKPPPITTSGVKNIQNLVSRLTREEAAGHEQQLKTFANGDVKILTEDEHQFKRTIKILEESKVEYHRFQLKGEKKFRVVIRGLHPETELCEIKRDLAEKGHNASDVSNIQIKKKSNVKDKNSEWTRINLPLFFVDLVPQDNNKDIYNLDSLCYHKIKIEAPRKRKEVPQCKNCQAFGHTQNYCHKMSVCVKCGEKHRTEDCQKPKKSKAKCANCGEAHTANWKGCSAYKKAEERAHPKKVSAVQRIQQKPAKTVTASTSYAQMASSTANNATPKTSKQQQQTSENDSTLADILSALTNITKSLVNVTSRLDRLECNQSKSNNKSQKKKK